MFNSSISIKKYVVSLMNQLNHVPLTLFFHFAFFVFTMIPYHSCGDLVVFFLMLVASFSGLYCSITHLHVYQCQPASLMNTQQLYFSLHDIPYPGVDHLIELLPLTWRSCSNIEWKSLNKQRLDSLFIPIMRSPDLLITHFTNPVFQKVFTNNKFYWIFGKY